MPKQLAVFLAALMAAGTACSPGSEEPARAVATPSVSLSRSDAAVGSPLHITYRFAVADDAPPFPEDYIVFVHFVDPRGERMWTDDHEPPVPTREWKAGEAVEYTRTVFIPKFPYIGTTSIQVGLYSPESGERVPLAGQDAGLRAYQVGSFEMTRQAESTFVTFADGWHQAEADEQGELEWHWSTDAGTITFPNPKRDAELFLQVDQVVGAFLTPQRVDVRLGTATLDRFLLPPGTRELRRISLPEALLGSGDTAAVAIAVDKTFVPAEVPDLRSSDSRELGIRVFRAYVEPK